MTKATLTVLSSTTVVPAKPTEKQQLYLSSLDLFWRDTHYNHRLLFYELPSSDYAGVVQKLQTSLAAALVHFFPWAGRLAKGKDGRFAIDCNDAGVELVQASIDASFSDLGDSFEFPPYFRELTRLGHLTSSDLCDIPLLSLQVTRFLDGVISIGVSHSHVVADGHSLWLFMVSWGECARGVSISKAPIHDRRVFKPEVISEEVAKRNPVKLVESEWWAPGPLESRMFHFSQEVMTRLKGMAKGAGKAGAREASTLEAVSAHCWRRVTAARRLAEEEVVSCVMLANWRWPRRGGAAPPVSEAYFGNAVFWMETSATAGEILSEDFPATVARVMGVVDTCTNLDSLHSFIHWLELHNTLMGLDHLWFPGISVNLASSPRFPAYSVDFGWGSPTCVCPARVSGYGGELCMFAGSSDGIDISINLHPSHMEHLRADPLFLHP